MSATQNVDSSGFPIRAALASVFFRPWMLGDAEVANRYGVTLSSGGTASEAEFVIINDDEVQFTEET